MAKRKRLSPAILQGSPTELGAAGSAPERKSFLPPIAGIASDAASSAMIEEISHEMQKARTEGRMVLLVKLGDIELNHLVRDRVGGKDKALEELESSIRARGQQTPVDVVALEPGRYGLISGWRRCQAIAKLATDAGQRAEDAEVRVLLRAPKDASDAYLSMVEENELRVGLSYYERARIAAKAVEQGVFDTSKAALLSLFNTASRSKRSKIRSFLGVVQALDEVLKFPQEIGERLGLQLARQLDENAGFAAYLTRQLRQEIPKTAKNEQDILVLAMKEFAKKDGLERSLETKPKVKAHPYSERELRPGLLVRVYRDTGQIVLSGEALTPTLRGKLLTWLEGRL